MGSITISASFGAHGDRIARGVAEHLGLPFVDRAIPMSVARQLNMPAEEAEAHDERAPSRLSRFFQSFSGLTPVSAEPLAPTDLQTPDDFRIATERVLLEISNSTGAVFLGRAGMIVLKDRPDVLRVRLDGPREARIAQAVADGMDEGEARQAQDDVDSAREEYVKYFYRARQDDMSLYHVFLDSTALSDEVCVEIITAAAGDRFASPQLSTQHS